MSMPRLLILITDLEIGGTPTVVRELATRLHHTREVKVKVACLGRWGPVADQIQNAGVDVEALGAGGAWDLRVPARFARAATQFEPDVVLSFLVHANAVAAVAGGLLSDTRFFQSIQTTQPRPRWHWAVQRLVHPMARRILVPSTGVARAAMAWSGIPAEKIVVIPNAIDPADFKAMPELDPTTRPFPVGFIGRLDPIKRIPDLVRAVASQGSLLHLHIFGEGRERTRIEEQVAALGLSELVTMHGAVHDPREALRQVGVLVLPSAAEGFGLVLIEAMAAGVPVVATDIPGIRDVVEEGRTGLLVPVAQIEQLGRAIRRMVNDAALRQKLVANGKAQVRLRFSWERVLARYRAVLGI